MGSGKEKYYLAGIVLGACILLAVIAGAAIRFLPVFRAARTLRQMLEDKNIDFEINASLAQKQLSEQQEKFLQAVSWILQVNEENCLSWKIQGQISGTKAYAQVFCEGLDGAVTDIYADEDNIVVNARVLYETLQHNFTAAHPFMGSLLPDWQYHDYITSEQIEEIFQVDIRNMFKQDLPRELSSKSFLTSLKLLQEMEYKENEEGRQQFAVVWNSRQMAVQAVICPGERKEIRLADSVMGEDETEQFKNLWAIIKGLQGKIGKER